MYIFIEVNIQLANNRKHKLYVMQLYLARKDTHMRCSVM